MFVSLCERNWIPVKENSIAIGIPDVFFFYWFHICGRIYGLNCFLDFIGVRNNIYTSFKSSMNNKPWKRFKDKASMTFL